MPGITGSKNAENVLNQSFSLQYKTYTFNSSDDHALLQSLTRTQTYVNFISCVRIGAGQYIVYCWH